MLPGLDQLIAVCQRQSLVLTIRPPLTSPSPQGELFAGEPLDPQLATLYNHVGAGTFGPLSLYDLSDEEEGLIPRNQSLREYDEVQFRASLIFGWKPGFAYYYGTVPKLASAGGLQPIIFISAMEELFAIPIASSVDRFLSLYSRYLELMVEDRDYVDSGIPYIQFPWDIVSLVIQDAPLIEQVRAGQFDFLTGNYRGALEWLQKLHASAP